MSEKLYKQIKTGPIEDETNQVIKKVNIIFDLKGKTYTIDKVNCFQRITILNNSCKFCLEFSDKKKSIVLNNSNTTILVPPKTEIVLSEYDRDCKLVVVQYLEVNACQQ